MSGNGVAGILSSLLRIITKVAEPDTARGQQNSGIAFFSLAAGVILICIVSYLVLIRLPITKFYMSTYKGETTPKNINQEIPAPVRTGEVARKVWKEATVVWAAFFVTLSLFPGLTSLIQPTSKALSADWFGILFVATFTFGDLVGRTLPKWFVVFSVRTIWVPTLARFVFFILFPLCVKEYIHTDALYYIIMAVFAISNGYIGSLAMMFGPTNAAAHEKEKAGLIMSFALNFGIFCGVHFALLLLYLLTGSIGV
jgi:equilibrative nucleoside transporter 1/2/3